MGSFSPWERAAHVVEAPPGAIVTPVDSYEPPLVAVDDPNRGDQAG